MALTKSPQILLRNFTTASRIGVSILALQPRPMTHLFEPFTPEEFKKSSGLDAADNEAIYTRWVNTQINYATYKFMQEMAHSLKLIAELLNSAPLKEHINLQATK